MPSIIIRHPFVCEIFGIASTRLEDGNYTAYTIMLSHRGPDSYGDYYINHRPVQTMLDER